MSHPISTSRSIFASFALALFLRVLGGGFGRWRCYHGIEETVQIQIVVFVLV